MEQEPKYLKDVLAVGRQLQADEARVAYVKHDAWCALLQGTGACNCEPIVKLGERLA